MQAIISDIQHFSIGDGPGIRTTVFFKGCNLFCPWCHNPETIDPRPQLLYFERRCTHCGNCTRICAQHILQGQEHTVNHQDCIGCGRCATDCSTGALKLNGKSMETAEILQEIAVDADFYRESGGGVTFSGGEPLLQAAACAHLGEACKRADIPVLLDTAGSVPYRLFEKVLPYVQQVYLDIKGYDALQLQTLTGADLPLILRNLEHLIFDKVDVTMRMPVIPGYNDTPEAAEKTARLLLDHGNPPLHLLPFHRLGSEKYAALGKNYRYRKTPSLPPESLQKIKDVFIQHGIATEIIR